MSDELKMSLKSMNISEEKKSQFKQLFPEVFTENKVDFERLKQVLGEQVETGRERYGMNWAGKSNCFKIIQEPSFGTLKPCKEESVNFDTSENIFIEGDNLEVLKLLQKSYYAKIKMIYIDPPYNTGNEFIYPDNFSESLDTYLKYTGQKDAEGKKFSTNQETDGRYHSKWMNMIYPRLYLSRNLLKDDGVIFISIDDNEYENLKRICDEIFGVENYLATVVWKKKTGAGAKPKGFITLHEYILAITKNALAFGDIETPLSEKTKQMYRLKDEHFEKLGPYATWPLDTTSMDERRNLRYPLIFDGIEIWPQKQWLWSKEKAYEAQKNNMLVFNKQKDGSYTVRFKGYLYQEDGEEKSGKPVSVLEGPYTQEGTKDFQEYFERSVFPFPKPVALIKQLINFKNNDHENKDAIVLDFFAGSGTTAEAVMSLNLEDEGSRKFILVQLPEVCSPDSDAYKAGYKTIAEISKNRIRKAISKAKKDPSKTNLDLGFKVLKLSSSNFKTWETGHTQDVAGSLKFFADHIDHSSKSEDILYEILLKSGFELTTKIEKTKIEGIEVFSIEDGAMFIYLGDVITKEFTYAIAEKAPSRFVCLDHSFHHNDQLKTNTVQLMKSRNIEFRTV